ncbi:MAG: hypothetical protein A3F13_00625 [Gammaproteobacteria bacterium RIFCSPHIGHO2_12_FULL_40_19]|nr:MAG: hypothetical protein A3F13_00625 [Gammaproteobacteria bacterium RIFCSPHIGHO2_12_FULL_40_19]
MRHIKLMLILIIVLASLLSGCAHIPSESLPSVSAPNTTNKTALRIYQTLPVYAKAAKMPWEPVQTNNIQLSSIVRERLTALGIMHGDSLSEAITEFQVENGVKQTGHMNQATLNALNITPAQRYRVLVDSMNAWAKYPEDQNSRYIQVNIPSYSMRLISHGEEVLQMKAIVGRPSRPTPLLTSKVTTIVFNPSWTVPETILAKDVIPGMRENPNYMKEHYDMRVYANHDKNAPEISTASIDWKTATASNFKYRVTAPPSAMNPLGRFKFIFENDHDVYMHDTPEKAVFAMNDRARSSGCIRLENPLALVEYFYADNTDLNAELVNQYLSTYQTKYIQLRNAIPVYVTYILAWVDPQGHAHFAEDIYQRSANS